MAVHQHGCDSAVVITACCMQPITQLRVRYCFYTTVWRHKCVNKKRDNKGVSLKTPLCGTTSFRHRFKSQLDSFIAEPEPGPTFLIWKRHFRTSNEGTLSRFIESLLYYCIKSSIYYSLNYISWHKNIIICKIIVDLVHHHDTRCEKYCKRKDTNSKRVGVLLSLEYRTAGKSSQPIRFKNQRERL